MRLRRLSSTTLWIALSILLTASAATAQTAYMICDAPRPEDAVTHYLISIDGQPEINWPAESDGSVRWPLPETLLAAPGASTIMVRAANQLKQSDPAPLALPSAPGAVSGLRLQVLAGGQ